jgi:hypothetical protein
LRALEYRAVQNRSLLPQKLLSNHLLHFLKKSKTVISKEIIEWTIHDLSNQRIDHVCQGSLVSVTNLKNCVLVIPNETPALSLKNLRKCIVIAENVSGSA